jgi:hypothetical protein
MSIDPGTAMLGAAGISAATGIGGAFMANNAMSGDTAREAGRRSVDVGTDQAVINSQLMAPYVGAGYNALADIYGIGKTGGGATSSAPSGSYAVPVLQQTGSKWDSPTVVGYDYYGKTGAGIDPTGGAGEFLNALRNYGSGYTSKYNPGGYIDELKNLKVDFNFNADDPAYQYKKEQLEKSINRSLAARGLYDSRAGINALSEGNRALISDEVDKQYARDVDEYNRQVANVQSRYGMAGTEDEREYTRGKSNLTDLFNMSTTLGGLNYGKAMDLVKVGTGASAAAGNLGQSSANALGSSYQSMGQMSNQNQANNAALWSGIGNIPANALGAYAAYRSLAAPQQASKVPYIPAY